MFSQVYMYWAKCVLNNAVKSINQCKTTVILFSKWYNFASNTRSGVFFLQMVGIKTLHVTIGIDTVNVCRTWLWERVMGVSNTVQRMLS